jgi:dTDP-4-amino-4,6-dideoxy-D-galactose acyltransferase
MSPLTEVRELVTQLAWDTEFFGFSVASVLPPKLSAPQMAQVLAWSQENSIRCLYWLADSTAPDVIEIARQNEFDAIDLRLQLECSRLKEHSPTRSEAIHPARRSDLDQLTRLSAATQQDNRFHKDRRFPALKASDLYAQWVQRDLAENHVLVSKDEGDRITGFISYRAAPGASAGSISLLSVSQDYSGRGIGFGLTQAATHEMFSRGCSRVTVVTQGSNIGAQRVYQNAGFRTASTGTWFHRWFDF